MRSSGIPHSEKVACTLMHSSVPQVQGRLHVAGPGYDRLCTSVYPARACMRRGAVPLKWNCAESDPGKNVLELLYFYSGSCYSHLMHIM